MRRIATLLLLALASSHAAAFDCPPANGRLPEPFASTLAIAGRPGVTVGWHSRAVRKGLANPPVPADVQDRTLRKVLAAVAAFDACHGNGPRPVVQIDLDYTVFVHEPRTFGALLELAEVHELPELRFPESLPILPSYEPRAFRRFLELSGIAARHPGKDWEAVHASFMKISRTPKLRGGAALSPGIHAFLRRIDELCGIAVFHTARPEKTRALTTAILAEGGLDHVPMVMAADRDDVDEDEGKRLAQAQIDRLGVTVAIIDDLEENRAAVIRANGPHTIGVAVSVPGFTTDLTPDELAQVPDRISTFELR